MKEAAPDTTRPSEPLDLAALRRKALEGVEYNKTTVFGRHSDAPIGIDPVDVLSLLDRIEELEKSEITWKRRTAQCEGWFEPDPVME